MRCKGIYHPPALLRSLVAANSLFCRSRDGRRYLARIKHYQLHAVPP